MITHKEARQPDPLRPSSIPMQASSRSSRARYYVLGLSFLVGLVMYLDRACMGTATPMIMREFRLDKITMGWSVSAFNWSYALFQIPGGWLADRFGSRIVLAGAIAWWSIFTAATGLASSAMFAGRHARPVRRRRSGGISGRSRSLLRWLPVEQRAFGQGFQHSGSRLGAACAPTLVVFLMALFSWRAVFYVFGAVGILVAIAWYWYYRDFPQEHPRREPGRIGAAAMRRGDAHPKASAAVPWRRILHSRDLLCLSLMYFCYGWVFWMYLQWLPTYLAEVRHFTQIKMGLAASLPLIAATDHERGGRLALRQAGPAVGRSSARPGGGRGCRFRARRHARSCRACWRTTRSPAWPA